MYTSLDQAFRSRRELREEISKHSPAEVGAMIWRLLGEDPEAVIQVSRSELVAHTTAEAVLPTPVSSYRDLHVQVETVIPPEPHKSVREALMGVYELASKQATCPVALLAKDPAKLFRDLSASGKRVFGIKIYKDATIDEGSFFLAAFAAEPIATVADATVLARFCIEAEDEQT